MLDSERRLLSGLIDDDPEVWREITIVYTRRVERFLILKFGAKLTREDRDEIFNSVLFRLWQDRREARLTAASMWPWICAITVRLALEVLGRNRRRNRERATDPVEFETLLWNSRRGQVMGDSTDFSDEFLNILNQLRPWQQSLLRLDAHSPTGCAESWIVADSLQIEKRQVPKCRKRARYSFMVTYEKWLEGGGHPIDKLCIRLFRAKGIDTPQ